MSFLGGLFRKRPLAELVREADELFTQSRFGEAKLAYDKVEARAAKEQPDLLQRAQQRVSECCDCIADKRIAEAKELARAGHLDLAREELKHAIETAHSEPPRARARAALTALEQREAKTKAEAPAATLSDEERLTLIAGSWEPLQAEELEGYGEPLQEALLTLDDGRARDALTKLLALAENAKQASYLWLEIARAHLAVNQLDESEKALRTFLTRIGPEEGGTARLMAHRELARIAHERGQQEQAVAELEACCAALEGDPRPLLDLGNYLRTVGRAHEAIEVLELCAQTFEHSAVEWPVTMEIGLACADSGDSTRAIRALEDVVQTLLARGHNDLPPQAAVPLAKLHEAGGNLARAADLYRALSQGEDRANHATYHSEAGRLLEALGMPEEATRMRERAAALHP